MPTALRARLVRWTRPVVGAACAAALAGVVGASHPAAQQQQAPPAQPAGQPPPAQPPATPAGQAGAPADQPTFRGGINFVRVDVIATDGKAQPVLDLKQTEFEVLEDGQPQSIEQFRL